MKLYSCKGVSGRTAPLREPSSKVKHRSTQIARCQTHVSDIAKIMPAMAVSNHRKTDPALTRECPLLEATFKSANYLLGRDLRRIFLRSSFAASSSAKSLASYSYAEANL
jgi:hypothetical protein